MEFSEKDIAQINCKGIRPEQVLRQLEAFEKGIPHTAITAPATVGNGILKLSDTEQQECVSRYENVRDRLDTLKFVPASGAASRMFASLFRFLKTFDPKEESVSGYIGREKTPDIRVFFKGLEKFPFYDEVLSRLPEKYPDVKQLSADVQKQLFVQEMLSEEGCNYGTYPKALLPFHRYNAHVATALEEHLFEAASYGSSGGAAALHFTVSEHRVNDFQEVFQAIRDRVGEKTSTCFSVGFSHQKAHTDTIAVDLNNRPYRKEDGSLLFRPSGHGALLENLNAHPVDIVFIKNVDNVVVHTYERELAFYKKMLAGKLLMLREQLFDYARLLDTSTPSPEELIAIKQFLTDMLHAHIDAHFEGISIADRVRYLKDTLNRPLRVCGLVKNEGQPGGGPFWVQDAHGNVSLQIVEVAQINTADPVQRECLNRATHFNPVDVVCSVRNYKGEKYDLLEFTARDQGFISSKSEAGTTIKTLELPGLWNGAMAHWHTVFVDVPLRTFNPVKTVNDLLKPAHQTE